MENRIVNTARDLYFRYGIRSVTLDDIAKELGISKKTIYQHFKDKDELVQRVVESSVNDELERAQEIRKNAQNPIEEVIMSMRLMKEMLQEINLVLFYDLQKYHPESFFKYTEFKKHFYDIIKQNLIEGVKKQLYRPEINIEILTRYRMEVIDMGFNPQIFPQNQFKQTDIHLEITDTFLRGILSPKGLELYEKTKLAI
jgi:AcrR family transcriptional regulator